MRAVADGRGPIDRGSSMYRSFSDLLKAMVGIFVVYAVMIAVFAIGAALGGAR